MSASSFRPGLDFPMDWRLPPFLLHHDAALAISILDLAQVEILPARANIFRAFDLCSPDQARVIVLGQDPYPTPGHATGLAFSVNPQTPLPRSLNNIFKELFSDVGVSRSDGDLTCWAEQGVLLANTALTTMPGVAGAHEGVWREFTNSWVRDLGQDASPRAWILWGRHAQSYRHLIAGHHLIIESSHPSPLSARRGFFGSKPFSRANAFLNMRGFPIIRW